MCVCVCVCVAAGCSSFGDALKKKDPWHRRVTVSLLLDRINVSRCYRLTPGGPEVPSPCAAATSTAMRLPATPLLYECPDIMQRPPPPPPPASPRSGFARAYGERSPPSAASASACEAPVAGSDANPIFARSSEPDEFIGVANEAPAPGSTVRHSLCYISVFCRSVTTTCICYLLVGGKVTLLSV